VAAASLAVRAARLVQRAKWSTSGVPGISLVLDQATCQIRGADPPVPRSHTTMRTATGTAIVANARLLDGTDGLVIGDGRIRHAGSVSDAGWQRQGGEVGGLRVTETKRCPMPRTLLLLVACLSLGSCAVTVRGQPPKDARPRKVVLIAGPLDKSHPPGT